MYRFLCSLFYVKRFKMRISSVVVGDRGLKQSDIGLTIELYEKFIFCALMPRGA